MRVAVVQLGVQPDGRAATLQGALRAIDAVASRDPAPDIVLLPAFNDVPRFKLGRSSLTERCEGQTVAACGAKAKHWGVFVGLGLAETGPGRPYVTGVLIDRDADAILVQRQLRFDPSEESLLLPGRGIQLYESLWGRMGLLVGDDLLARESWQTAVQGGAGFLLGVACWAERPDPSGDFQNGPGSAPCSPGDAPHAPRSSPKPQRRIQELAAEFGIGCAVADVTWHHDDAVSFPGHSMIVGYGGDVLAVTAGGRHAVLFGELSPAAGSSAPEPGA